MPTALPADRPSAARPGTSARRKVPQSNPWRLQATLPNTVIKDISFASPTVGYIAGELGKVWKTTNGGNTWTQIMNLGYPYYWYPPPYGYYPAAYFNYGNYAPAYAPRRNYIRHDEPVVHDNEK